MSPVHPAPKDVIIVGGSLSGLLHGIALHRLGCRVYILEQSPGSAPVSHMAGIALGPDVLHFLSRFDRVKDTVSLGIPSVLLQSLDSNGQPRPFLRATRIMSSWDALYFRLRANYDGLCSEYVRRAPGPLPLDGESIESARDRARYLTEHQVTAIEEEPSGDRVRVTVTAADGATSSLTADVVLGADGPNSFVRRAFLDHAVAQRQSAGYVAWRGVVQESEVSFATQQIFRENITYSILRSHGAHVIVYYIPGEGGSVEPGHRVLNFCWYSNQRTSDLDSILTDIDGIRHRITVPPHKLRPEIWAHQQKVAEAILSPPYLEIVRKISPPFVHLITDYCSPRVSFLGGKVLLVGDASALLRPHIAFSTNQAAYQASLTERLVKGEIRLEEWQYQVTAATHLHWRRSVWFGEFFQRPWPVALGSAVLYWGLVVLNAMRRWMGWVPKQAV